jgi:allantoinase
MASSEPFDLVVVADRAVVQGDERAIEVGVRDGRIEEIVPLGAGLAGVRTICLGADEVLLPGFVDSHVHSGDPGNVEWEGFANLTRAAAAAGVTTIVDMPIDSIPPTTSVAGVEAKRAALLASRPAVDVAFWGGLVPWNVDDLAGLVAAGVRGIKAFLADTGDPEFPGVGIDRVEAALAVLAPLDVPLLVHCEDARAASALPPPAGRRYGDYLASRPRGIENLAVAGLIEAARQTGGWAHVVHVSSADVLPMVASARADGVRLTTETCPHYLALAAEDVPDGDTRFKCSPPIREGANRERLWAGLADGTLDQIVSDHSPSTPAMKIPPNGSFAEAWAGISSLQLAPAVTWTAAAERGFRVTDLVRWTAEAPARLAGLHAKGAIAIGRDADLVVFAPDETFVVDPDQLEHRHPVTPYGGRTLRGRVRRTILRGDDAYPFDERPATGRIVPAMTEANPLP